LILGTMRRRKGAAHVVEIVAANNNAARTADNLAAGAAHAGAGPGPVEGSGADDGAKEARRIDAEVWRQLEQVGVQLESIMARIAPAAGETGRSSLAAFKVNLENAGFDPGIVQRRFLQRESAPGGSFHTCLEEIIREVPLETPEERVSIFVGPSGSGKTTALLKVASAALKRTGVKPVVIHYAPGEAAADARRLATLAKDLGLKVKAISREAKLEREVEKSGNVPVLIDTPGIARLGEGGIEFLAGLTGRMEGAKVRLVVSAGMDPANITAIASCIPDRAPVSLVLTKLDEATRIGGAVSAAIRTGIPLAYLAGGDDIRSGIFIPDRGILYDRIMEGLADTGTGGN
jgi:flagellar biosynthesis protein FlhF